MTKRAHVAGRVASEPEDLERLRLESLLVDSVTGLPMQPLAGLRRERVDHLGIIYLQLGRFSGVESLYGWELYDRVLKLTAGSLQADLEASPLKPCLLSLQYTGADGFYLLLDLPGKSGEARATRLEDEARRLRDGVIHRLRHDLGRTTVDLMSVQVSALRVSDDPRVRPSRNVVRALHEAARIVDQRESRERQELVADFRKVIASRKLRPVFQPVVDIKDGSVAGYEALIRGPLGSTLEAPDVLFAAAKEGGLGLELESLCLETIFRELPPAAQEKTLFVNASAKLLAHSVFLDERNLDQIHAAHPNVVMEISEKEVVRDYAAFREVIERLRSSGLRMAIDDAGSGYSGLESILQLRPEYIKVADTIVHGLHTDTIKREIITALASLGDQIHASIVAEGIEFPEELETLRSLGVAYGQGYLLGRPSPRIEAVVH